MRRCWLVPLVILVLVGCDGTAETAVPTAPPELAGMQAAATQTAVFRHQSATAAAVEATRQAVAWQATAGAIQQETATAVAAQETATVGALYAHAQVAATGTAVAIITQRELAASTATVQAANVMATATAQSAALRWEKQQQMGTFWAWVRWLGLALFVGFGAVIIYGLKRHFEYRTSDLPEIIDGEGRVVGLPRNYVALSRPAMQLAAPEPAAAPPINNMVPVNGQPQPKQRRGARLHYKDESYDLSGRNIDKLWQWYQQGHKTIRRDPSRYGPGFSKLPDPVLSENYTTLLGILQGRGLVADNRQWTELGEWFLRSHGLPHPEPINNNQPVVSRDDDDDDGIDGADGGRRYPYPVGATA